MLDVERQLIDACRRRRGRTAGLANGAEVEAAIQSRPSLAREQATVIRGLTRSGDGVQVVRAAAGTGKTYALDASREAWEASGCAVPCGRSPWVLQGPAPHARSRPHALCWKGERVALGPIVDRQSLRNARRT
jgi:hypothetical protein